MVFDRFDIFVIALVILVVVTVAMGVRTIPQGYAYTVERFGRYARTLGPGLSLILPYVETVGKKVRAAQLQKVPYVLVIGDKEIESGELTVRDRGGTETQTVPLDAFTSSLVEEAASRRLTQSRFGD